jgi:prepilin-type N-terminal cleavage/methylation domain-containing protein
VPHSHGKAGRGFSLIEVLIAMFLSGLILYVVYSMYVHSRNQVERPMATSAIETTSMTLQRWLQDDLSEVNIQTLRTFPNTDNPSEPPGMSFESPRTTGDSNPPDELRFGKFGVPLWQKYVYYTLKARSDNPQMGELIRCEMKLNEGNPSPVDGTYLMPMASTVLPSAASGSTAQKTRRVLAGDLMLPNQTISHAEIASLGVGNHGGFEVFWLKNPAALGAHTYYDDNPQDRGNPVYIDAVLHDVSPRTGKDTVFRLSMRVKAQN